MQSHRPPAGLSPRHKVTSPNPLADARRSTAGSAGTRGPAAGSGCEVARRKVYSLSDISDCVDPKQTHEHLRPADEHAAFGAGRGELALTGVEDLEHHRRFSVLRDEFRGRLVAVSKVWHCVHHALLAAEEVSAERFKACRELCGSMSRTAEEARSALFELRPDLEGKMDAQLCPAGPGADTRGQRRGSNTDLLLVELRAGAAEAARLRGCVKAFREACSTAAITERCRQLEGEAVQRQADLEAVQGALRRAELRFEQCCNSLRVLAADHGGVAAAGGSDAVSAVAEVLRQREAEARSFQARMDTAQRWATGRLAEATAVATQFAATAEERQRQLLLRVEHEQRAGARGERELQLLQLRLQGLEQQLAAAVDDRDIASQRAAALAAELGAAHSLAARRREQLQAVEVQLRREHAACREAELDAAGEARRRQEAEAELQEARGKLRDEQAVAGEAHRAAAEWRAQLRVICASAGGVAAAEASELEELQRLLDTRQVLEADLRRAREGALGAVPAAECAQRGVLAEAEAHGWGWLRAGALQGAELCEGRAARRQALGAQRQLAEERAALADLCAAHGGGGDGLPSAAALLQSREAALNVLRVGASRAAQELVSAAEQEAEGRALLLEAQAARRTAITAARSAESCEWRVRDAEEESRNAIRAVLLKEQHTADSCASEVQQLQRSLAKQEQALSGERALRAQLQSELAAERDGATALARLYRADGEGMDALATLLASMTQDLHELRVHSAASEANGRHIKAALDTAQAARDAAAAEALAGRQRIARLESDAAELHGEWREQLAEARAVKAAVAAEREEMLQAIAEVRAGGAGGAVSVPQLLREGKAAAARLSAELEQHRSQSSAQVSQLQAELQAAAAERQRLQSAVAALGAEKDEARRQCAALQSELQQERQELAQRRGELAEAEGRGGRLLQLLAAALQPAAVGPECRERVLIAGLEAAERAALARDLCMVVCVHAAGDGRVEALREMRGLRQHAQEELRRLEGDRDRLQGELQRLGEQCASVSAQGQQQLQRLHAGLLRAAAAEETLGRQGLEAAEGEARGAAAEVTGAHREAEQQRQAAREAQQSAAHAAESMRQRLLDAATASSSAMSSAAAASAAGEKLAERRCFSPSKEDVDTHTQLCQAARLELNRLLGILNPAADSGTAR